MGRLRRVLAPWMIGTPLTLRERLAFGLAVGVAIYQLQGALRWERQFIVPYLSDPARALSIASPPFPGYTMDTIETAQSVIPADAAVCVSTPDAALEDLIRYHTAYGLFPRPITECSGSASDLWSLEVGTARLVPTTQALVVIGRAEDPSRPESLPVTHLSPPDGEAILLKRSRGPEPKLVSLSISTAPTAVTSGVLRGRGFAPGDRLVIDHRYVIATEFVSPTMLEFTVPRGVLPPFGSAGLARLPSLLPASELRARLAH